MDPIATNDNVNAGDNLADERNLDKPTDVEQHGENEQNSAPEQVFETNASGSHIEGQTYNIDDNAQSLVGEKKTENTDSQSLTTRPKRQAKPSLKFIQNRMQIEQSKATKLWDKVQSLITTLQTTPDSIPQLRFALCKVRAAFHDYQMPVVSYIDYLVHVGTPECMEEREKVERILDNHKHYVDTVVAEGNERKKELIAEMGSARPSSRASSTSSAALRAQARGEAAAAIKKAELQKKRNQIESQLALQIQEQELALSRQKLEEKARLEQLRLEKEAEVAVAKIAAIEDELGISDPRGFDLPEERVDQRVNSYLENTCEFTPDNIDTEQPRAGNYQVRWPSNYIATQHPTAPPSQPQYPTASPLLPQHPTASPSQQQYPTAPPLLPQHPTASPSQQQYPTAPSLQPQHPTLSSSQQHPTVPPLQLQHPNSQPLDRTTSAFNPSTRITPPSEPREDTMKSYTDFMARRELTANKIEKFDDQPGNYHIWKESFQNMIRHVHITPSEELSLITEHTTKNSNWSNSCAVHILRIRQRV